MFFRSGLSFLAAWLILTSMGFSPALALDEVIYRALADKQKVKVGEKFQFMVRVDYGYNTMAPAIKAPSFAQFNILDEFEKTEVQGEGPDKFMIKKNVWLLEAMEVGRISIASAIVTYQDPTTNLLQNGKTDVIFVEVEPAAEATPSGPSGAGNQPLAQKNRLGLWSALAGLLAGVGIAFLLLRSGKPAEKKIPPEDVALNNLQQALGKVEEGNLEAYYAILSRTLLDYLQAKFNLDAYVLSTDALLKNIRVFGFADNMIRALEEFFQVADKAKFAGYVPNEDEMIKLHSTVNQLIAAGRAIKIKPQRAEKKKKKDED